MTRDVLWDSGAILALLDASDADHRCATEVANLIAAQHRPSFITNYIEAETHALLLARLGRVIAREWLLRAALPIVRATPDDEAAAKELLSQYEDKNWSLCDATSFAVMKRRNTRFGFSFDHHFEQHGAFRIVGLPGTDLSEKRLNGSSAKTPPRRR